MAEWSLVIITPVLSLVPRHLISEHPGPGNEAKHYRVSHAQGVHVLCTHTHIPSYTCSMKMCERLSGKIIECRVALYVFWLTELLTLLG